MAAQRQYATAGAFRTALEARLNERARRDGVDLHRLRRQVAFDRLLARMFDPSQPVREGWVLKGRYALEMRFHMPRSTKDLDEGQEVIVLAQVELPQDAQPHGVLDTAPLSVDAVLRAFTADDDLLGDMLEGRAGSMAATHH